MQSSDGTKQCNFDINRLIREFIEQYVFMYNDIVEYLIELFYRESSKNILLGPECDTPIFQDKSLYCFDKIHFNSKV